MDTAMYRVFLGGVTPLPPSIFDNPDLYLAASFDNAAQAYPRSKVSSYPYAFHAETLEGNKIQTGTATITASAQWVPSPRKTIMSRSTLRTAAPMTIPTRDP